MATVLPVRPAEVAGERRSGRGSGWRSPGRCPRRPRARRSPGRSGPAGSAVRRRPRRRRGSPRIALRPLAPVTTMGARSVSRMVAAALSAAKLRLSTIDPAIAEMARIGAASEALRRGAATTLLRASRPDTCVQATSGSAHSRPIHGTTSGASSVSAITSNIGVNIASGISALARRRPDQRQQHDRAGQEQQPEDDPHRPDPRRLQRCLAQRVDRPDPAGATGRRPSTEHRHQQPGRRPRSPAAPTARPARASPAPARCTTPCAAAGESPAGRAPRR